LSNLVNKQTDAGENITSLTEVKKSTRWRQLHTATFRDFLYCFCVIFSHNDDRDVPTCKQLLHLKPTTHQSYQAKIRRVIAIQKSAEQNRMKT